MRREAAWPNAHLCLWGAATFARDSKLALPPNPLRFRVHRPISRFVIGIVLIFPIGGGRFGSRRSELLPFRNRRGDLGLPRCAALILTNVSTHRFR